MSEISFSSPQVHFKTSSLAPSTQTKTDLSSKTSQTDFAISSLAPAAQTKPNNPSKPQLPPSYQILLVEHVKRLDALQGALLKFDKEQIEKVAEKTKTVFSKLLEETGYVRKREMHAKKWQNVVMVMSGGIMIARFCPLPSVAVSFAALSTILPVLQASFTVQQLINKAYLLNTQAKVTRLDHEFKQGKHEQSRLTQNSGNTAFSILEEQIHLLAIALEKQIINI